MSETLSRLVLLSHLAATLYMMGVIWFVQIVHYPLFGRVGAGEFGAYERRHTALTTWVVAPPMLWEGLSGCLLLLGRPAGLSAWLLAVGLALLVVVWLSTALVQVPCHAGLSRGFDPATHRRLVRTNWIRTVAWTLRGLLLCFIVATLPG